jgi:hypothetical protein
VKEEENESLLVCVCRTVRSCQYRRFDLLLMLVMAAAVGVVAVGGSAVTGIPVRM